MQDTNIVSNPLLVEFKKVQPKKKPYSEGWMQESIAAYTARARLARKYAWAIPTPKVLKRIAALPQPIIELGAGTGYWASLLIQMGCQVDAFDIHPPKGKRKNYFNFYETYTRVKRGSPASTLKPNQKWKALLLCWPNYSSSFAYDAVSRFLGEYVVYIGEGNGGCTGDDAFHEYLYQHFEELEVIDIPQWFGIHDSVYILKRKATP